MKGRTVFVLTREVWLGIPIRIPELLFSETKYEHKHVTPGVEFRYGGPDQV
jgi:hypothetical protein